MKTLIAQPEERTAGRLATAFASRIPILDRWMRRRAVIGGLLAEASRLEGKAAEWEGRGHWQRAGRTHELSARMVERAMDFELRPEHAKRWKDSLRQAIVCYALEVGEAGRYDPAIQYRIYMVARKAGEAKVAAERLKKAMDGFNAMYGDPNLDALVRLNRLKREFLSELWEGEVQEALRISREAEGVAGTIRTQDGGTDRRKDTVAWMEEQIAKRFSGEGPMIRERS